MALVVPVIFTIRASLVLFDSQDILVPSSDTSSSGGELTFSNCVKKRKAVIAVSH